MRDSKFYAIQISAAVCMAVAIWLQGVRIDKMNQNFEAARSMDLDRLRETRKSLEELRAELKNHSECVWTVVTDHSARFGELKRKEREGSGKP